MRQVPEGDPGRGEDRPHIRDVVDKKGIQITRNPYEKWELCEACMKEIEKVIITPD